MIRPCGIADLPFMLELGVLCYPGEFDLMAANHFLTALLDHKNALLLRGETGGVLAVCSAIPWNPTDKWCIVQFLAFSGVAPWEMVQIVRQAKGWGESMGYPHFRISNYRNRVDIAPLARRLGLVQVPSTDWETPRV